MHIRYICVAGEAASQHAEEAASQLLAVATSVASMANQQPDVAASEQVYSVPEDAVNQQTVLYADDDMIQYVTSVDLSYYNQQPQSSTQQQQLRSDETHLLPSFPRALTLLVRWQEEHPAHKKLE